jgi:hypothetical protein
MHLNPNVCCLVSSRLGAGHEPAERSVDPVGNDRMRGAASADRRDGHLSPMHTLVGMHGQPGWVASGVLIVAGQGAPARGRDVPCPLADRASQTAGSPPITGRLIRPSDSSPSAHYQLRVACCPVNPSIEPAVIGAGAATAVALVSFVTNRATTRQTIEAGTANTVRALDAARDDRLWEKQTALYEEIITLMLYLSLRHRNEMRSGGSTAEKQMMKTFFSGYKRPQTFELQGRIHTYASDVVVAAYDAAKSAEDSLGDSMMRVKVQEDRMLEAMNAGNAADLEARTQVFERAAAEMDRATEKQWKRARP